MRMFYMALFEYDVQLYKSLTYLIEYNTWLVLVMVMFTLLSGVF